MDASTLKALFGRHTQTLRKRRGLTQEELAEAVRLSVEYVSKIERGLASPSFAVIARFADVLEVVPARLFDPEEPKGRG